MCRLVTQNEMLSALSKQNFFFLHFISFVITVVLLLLSSSMSLSLSEFLFWSNSLKILFYKIIVYSQCVECWLVDEKIKNCMKIQGKSEQNDN